MASTSNRNEHKFTFVERPFLPCPLCGSARYYQPDEDDMHWLWIKCMNDNCGATSLVDTFKGLDDFRQKN